MPKFTRTAVIVPAALLAAVAVGGTAHAALPVLKPRPVLVCTPEQHVVSGVCVTNAVHRDGTTWASLKHDTVTTWAVTPASIRLEVVGADRRRT